MFRMIRDVEELLEGKEAASLSPRSPALPLLNPEGNQLDSESQPSEKWDDDFLLLSLHEHPKGSISLKFAETIRLNSPGI